MKSGGGKSGKKPDNMLMELLSKMSEAYMGAKKENAEHQQTIENLQIENRLLRIQVTNLLKEKEEKKKENDVLMDTVLTTMTKSVKQFENKKYKIKEEGRDSEPVKSKKKIKEEPVQ